MKNILHNKTSIFEFSIIRTILRYKICLFRIKIRIHRYPEQQKRNSSNKRKLIGALSNERVRRAFKSMEQNAKICAHEGKELNDETI